MVQNQAVLEEQKLLSTMEIYFYVMHSKVDINFQKRVQLEIQLVPNSRGIYLIQISSDQNENEWWQHKSTVAIFWVVVHQPCLTAVYCTSKLELVDSASFIRAPVEALSLREFLFTKVLFLLKLFSSNPLPPAILAASLFRMADAFSAVGRLVKSWCQHEFRNPLSDGPHDSSSLGRPPLCTINSECIFLLNCAKGVSIFSICHSIMPKEYISALYPERKMEAQSVVNHHYSNKDSRVSKHQNTYRRACCLPLLGPCNAIQQGCEMQKNWVVSQNTKTL